MNHCKVKKVNFDFDYHKTRKVDHETPYLLKKNNIKLEQIKAYDGFIVRFIYQHMKHAQSNFS